MTSKILSIKIEKVLTQKKKWLYKERLGKRQNDQNWNKTKKTKQNKNTFSPMVLKTTTRRIYECSVWNAVKGQGKI